MPEVIRTYLSKRGFSEKADVEGLIAPGATLVLLILMIMHNLSEESAMASKAFREARASQVAQGFELAFDTVILIWADEEHNQHGCNTVKQLSNSVTMNDHLAENSGK